VEPNQLSIRTLDRPDELAAASALLQQVWSSTVPLVNVELLCAVTRSGGYVAVASVAGNLIGASFGFLARHRDREALHSHVTGLLPGVRHSGVGRAMKYHQRDWAAERSIEWITWTFDPLVRRNAWFNIKVLGADVARYHENFYGPITDSINAHDESDRLLMAWSTSPDSAPERDLRVAQSDRIEAIPTPPDIIAMRRADPDQAMRWRLEMRGSLGQRLSSGGRVIDFSRDGEYLVATEPPGEP